MGIDGIATGIAALRGQISEHKRLARFHRRRSRELSEALRQTEIACRDLGIEFHIEDGRDEGGHSHAD